MKRLAVFGLLSVLLGINGCEDQTTAPDLDLTPSFAKGGKPGKPDEPGGGGEDPSPADPAIAFVASSSSTDGSGINNDLMVMDADGGNQSVLIHSETDALFYPSWSPDLDPHTEGFQGRVVYERWPNNSGSNPTSVQLRIVDVVVQDGAVTAVNDRLFRDDALVSAWSPNGDEIAFIDGYHLPRGLVVRNIALETEVLLVPDLSPDEEFHVDWPAWSPEGDRLAYHYTGQDAEGEWYCAIKVRDSTDEVGTSEITVVQDVCARGIDWSRDGTKLAYKDGSGMYMVEVASLATPTPISNTLWAESPSWAPEGSSVMVYMTRKGKSGAGKRRIVRYDDATGNETLIAEIKGYHLWEPDWRRF